jgi:hypothetical protein
LLPPLFPSNSPGNVVAGSCLNGNSILQKAVEQLAATSRGSPVRTEDIFVKIVPEMLMAAATNTTPSPLPADIGIRVLSFKIKEWIAYTF